MAKKIIIIGAGIAGLSSGIYAQKAGYETVIYEKNAIPGGECIGWDRDGCHIDGCIHWLTGTNPEFSLYKVWCETGALGEDVEVIETPEFLVLDLGHKTVPLYKDMNKLKKLFEEIAPEDQRELKKLYKAIKNTEKQQIPLHPVEQMNPFEIAQLIFSGVSSSIAMKDFQMSAEEYLKRFKSEELRFLFQSILPYRCKADILAFILGTVMSGNGGRPKGGSLAMAQRMAKKYEDLGGKIIYNARVKKIIVENNRGTGIEIEGKNGGEALADWIIPACDVHITQHKLLNNKYPLKEFDERDADPATYPAITGSLASFMYDGDLSDTPTDIGTIIDAVPYEDGKIEFISLKHFSYEPSFAPKGKSVIQCLFQGNYEWWKNLTIDEKIGSSDSLFIQSGAYKKEKQRVLKDLQKSLEKRYAHFEGKLKALDLVTPLTYERYCGAYKGNWMAYTTTVHAKQLMHNGFIPGLEHVIMAGQWLMPSGGLPVALITGKWAVERICKKDKKNWRL